MSCGKLYQRASATAATQEDICKIQCVGRKGQDHWINTDQMCIYSACVHLYVYIHTYIDAYLSIYLSIHSFIYIHMHKHMYMCVCVCVCDV